MKRAAAFLVALLLAGPAAARCAGEDLTERLRAEDPAGFAAAEAAASAAPNAEGLLWRIEAPGAAPGAAPSALFGTLHVAEPLGRIEARALAEAKAARILLVELTEAEQAAMQAAMQAEPSLAFLPAPAPFADWLSPELAARAEARFAAVGLPRPVAELMRPWLLNTILALPPCAMASAAAGAPVLDARLMRAAEAAGAAVAGLETWREQFDALTGWSEEEQRAALRIALAAPEAPEDMLATQVALYEAGRPMLIWELGIARARAAAPDLVTDGIVATAWRLVAVERNRRMAERAAPELRKGGAMIAVGALHLPGAEGLVELLRAQGFTLTRVE